jgi:Lrp/AsnC family leucine-responsive transcriptional regulator
VQCFATAGDGDYLLQILVPGIGDLDQLLRLEISRLPGVQRITTTVCVKAIKNRSNIVDCLR